MIKTLDPLKAKLRGMGSGTALQVLRAMNDDYPSSPYTLQEIESQLEILISETHSEFDKAGDRYSSKKNYRVQLGLR